MSIIIKDVNKIYPNGNHALKNINLEIPPGMFGLLGPNGAGKSTLIRILVALMEPTSGSIEMYGCNLLKEREQARRIIGYLPQDFRFFAQYKTYEFLDYAACLSGMNNRKERKNAVDKMLESVGLYDVRDRYANRLSGGMKRRLGIAQALIHDPKVIIVDEPTTGLDPEERIRFRNLLSKASGNNVTIILSTHIVGDISSSCNMMTLLNKGELGFIGSPEEIINEAKGSVWRAIIPEDEFQIINDKFPVVSTIPVAQGWEIQVVSKEKPCESAEPYEPNLEHAYVYYMENKLNLWTKG
ncbi:MAG: ABC transporter ATP-binding protein [Bacteroidales bacterium]|nr:ABC transporter ATP-binding protein [Bacteroidales bacterium]